jgi:hypothetical protein
VSEDSNSADVITETAWPVIAAITGVVTAVVALSLAQALLAIGIVGLLWRFPLQARPLSLGWRPYLLAVSVMLSLIGATLLTTSALEGLSSAGPASPAEAPANPRTITESSSPSQPVPLLFNRSGSATVTLPRKDEVPKCWTFHGDARLRAGTTLVLGARRIDPPDEFTYFVGVEWTGQVGQSAWSAARWFGTVPYQAYRVFVIAITRKALDDVLAAHRSELELWRDRNLPSRQVAEVLRLPDVRQIPGPHNC